MYVKCGKYKMLPRWQPCIAGCFLILYIFMSSVKINNSTYFSIKYLKWA